MGSGLRAAALRLLKVPPEPQVPPGDETRVRVFRAAPNFYRYNLVRWGLKQAGALIGLAVGFFMLRAAPDFLAGLPYRVFFTIEALAWLGFLAQLPATFVLLRLDYEQRWYIVTERSLRVRQGLSTVREQTMTFANIQNMAIRQGPLQRLLGIADLEVHTAGGGAGGSSEGKGHESTGQPMHVAQFRGVDDAVEIRDLLRERVRRHRDAGLGDPDDPMHGPDPHHADAEPAAAHGAPAQAAAVSSPTAVLEAAQELLLEVRHLREAAVGGRRVSA